jgi:uncharacterized beta-barrel protein YwiB (DUF1934 family)
MKKATISIKGTPAMEDSEDVGFELLTDGESMSENGVSTFSYMESELTGINGMLTTFNVEPDRVVLSRGEGFGMDMIFSEDQKHHFLYDTPYGLMTMGIDTHSIKKNMRDDGGSLEIRYDIEVDNVAVSQNLFKITVQTCPQ